MFNFLNIYRPFFAPEESEGTGFVPVRPSNDSDLVDGGDTVIHVIYNVSTIFDLQTALETPRATIKLTPPANTDNGEIPMTTKTVGFDWFRLAFKGEYYTYSFDTTTGWAYEPNPGVEYKKPPAGIPESDLSPSVVNKINEGVELPEVRLGDEGKLVMAGNESYELVDAKYGWREPDQFVYTTTGDGQDTISPAIIQLTADERLTFVIIDEFHPDGIMLTGYTWSQDHYVNWEGECPGTGEIEYFGYSITYYADNDTNHILAAHTDPTDPDSVVYFSATFYAAGTIHKIPKDYVESDLPQLSADDLGAFVGVTPSNDGPVYGLVPNPAGVNILSWNDGSPAVSKYVGNLQRWQLKINSNAYIEQCNNSVISDGRLPPSTYDHHYFTRYLIENDAITTVEVYEVVTKTAPFGGTLSVVSGALYTKTLA